MTMVYYSVSDTGILGKRNPSNMQDVRPMNLV